MNRACKFLGLVIGVVIVMYMIAQLFDYESKSSAKYYRETYREQGRKQLRAEALEVGVAEIVAGEFMWRTNCTDELALRQEIYGVVIEALEDRRVDYAKRSEEESNEEGCIQEAEAEGKEEDSGQRQGQSQSQGQSQEGQDSGGSGSSEEEGKAAEGEETL